jgi:uncharacterized membrane protein HdeD (DUF308 family)
MWTREFACPGASGAHNAIEGGLMRIPIVDVETLSENWWVVAIRGLAGILFGVFTLLAPAISLAALVLVFGAWAFVDGVLAIVTAARRHGTSDRWWMLLLEGFAGVAIGLITLFVPGITALLLLYLIAARALITGVLQLVAAVRLRKAVTGEWLLVLGGIASVLWGLLLIIFPGPGALALVLWIGAFSFVFGALMLGLAYRLRSLGRTGPSDAAMRTV